MGELTVLQPGQVPIGFFDRPGQAQTPISNQPTQRFTAEDADRFFDLAGPAQPEFIDPEMQRIEQQNWFANFAREFNKRNFNTYEEYVDFGANLKDPNTGMPLVTDSNRQFVQNEMKKRLPRHLQEKHANLQAQKEAKKSFADNINMQADGYAEIQKRLAAGTLPPAGPGLQWEIKGGQLVKTRSVVDTQAKRQQFKDQERADMLRSIALAVGGEIPLWTKLPPGAPFTKPTDLTTVGDETKGFRRVDMGEIRKQIFDIERDQSLTQAAEAAEDPAAPNVQKHPEGTEAIWSDGRPVLYLQDPKSGRWGWVAK